ncbi:hypothetical protein [Streptomyces ambofaciens]|uniref:hypothetical protein n=1 Tax=Streptomyces ambofaciens TaxID=1889 RepID=UPI00069E35C5|nr:hypothetical protein [Streptomyces ambofaciens]
MVAALAALGVAVGVVRLVRLRRALDAERAARRLADGLHHHDMSVIVDRLNRRLGPAVLAGAVLCEADQVLDSVLSAHDPEGGSL